MANKKNKNKKNQQKRKAVRFESLEPRILLSADLLPLNPELKIDNISSEELVVDVDLNQVEDTRQFIIEGLDESLSDIQKKVSEEEADSQEINATEVKNNTEVLNEKEDIISPAKLLQQYWNQANRAESSVEKSLNNTAAIDTVNEIIIVDSAVENYKQLINDVVDSYLNSNGKNNTDSDNTSESDLFLLDRNKKEIKPEWNAPELIVPGSIITVDSNLQIFILDENKDGIDQISLLLENYKNLSALHVFSHANAGSLNLGNSNLNSSTLQKKQEKIKAWGQAMSVEGDILLYGCNVAEGEVGVEFVSQLSGLTGADVAASDDLTGADGDWQLEVNQGEIQTRTLVASNYAQNLLTLGDSSAQLTIDQTGLVEVTQGGNTTSYEKAELTGGNLTLGSANDTLNFNRDTTSNNTNFNSEAGDDIFNINGSTKLTGTLDAGADNDTINYTNFGGKVNVNLQTGTATGIAGSNAIVNFENVVGGKKADTLTGSDGNDHLSGGKGNDTLTGGLGDDTLIGGADDDTYVYANNSDWGNDTLVEVAGVNGGDDTLDFSGVDNDLIFTLRSDNGNAVFDIRTSIDGSGTGNLPIDTGNSLILPLAGTTPPSVDINGNVNLSNDLSFSIALEASLDAATNNDIKTVNTNFAGEGFQTFATDLKTELDAQYSAQQVASTNDYSVKYIAGQLLIENTRGENIKVWSGNVAAEPVGNQGRGNLAVIKGLNLPADSSVTTNLTIRVGSGIDEVVTELTISLAPTYDALSLSDQRKAWTSAIKTALNSANQIPLDYSAIIQQEINQQLESRWLNIIEENILSAIDTANVANLINAQNLSVNLSADGNQLKIYYSIISSGTSNAIWSNTTSPILAGNLSNTLNGVDNIENINASSADNVFIFNTLPDQNFNISPAPNGTVSLDFSALSEPMIVEISANGFVSVLINGNTIAANNVSSLVGGTGNNRYTFLKDAALDSLNPGSGNNSIIYEATFAGDLDIDLKSVNLRLPGVGAIAGNANSITKIITANANDTVVGNDSGNIIKGEGGGDILTGGAGVDKIDGGAQNDKIKGGAENDTLIGGSGNDVIEGGAGNDTIEGGTDNDTLFGNENIDTILGGAGDDIIEGGAGVDIVDGGAGNDTIIVGSGEGGTDFNNPELINGGKGNDTYQLEDNWGYVQISEGGTGAGKDTIDFSRINQQMVYILSDGNIVSGTGAIPADIDISTSERQGSFTQAPSNGSVPGIETYNFNNALSSTSIENLEVIRTGSAESRFLFGSDWGLATTNVSDFITAWRNVGQTIALDTSALSTAGNNLVLDFRGVDQELEFVFKEDGSLEISRVEDIEWIKRFLGDGIVDMAADFTEWMQDKERWDRGFEITFNTIVVSNIDANTVIYGGRNSNTFQVEQNAVFAGEVIGGTGFKPFKDNLSQILEENSAGFSIPEVTDLSQLTVTNELDLTERDGDQRAKLNSSYGNIDLSRWKNIDDIKFDPSGVNVIVGSSLTTSLNNTITIDGGVSFASLFESNTTGASTVVSVQDNTAAIGDYSAGSAELFNVYDIASVNGTDLVITGDQSAKFSVGSALEVGNSAGVNTAGNITNVQFVAVNNSTTVTLDADVSTLNTATDYIRLKNTTLTISDIRDKSTGFIRQVSFSGNVKADYQGNTKFELAQGSNRVLLTSTQAKVPKEFDALNFGFSAIMGGLGGDTYKFEGGLWGLGVIAEPPDINVNTGDTTLGLPEFYDTLDFSDTDLNLQYDVYNVTTANIDILNEFFINLNKDDNADPATYTPPIEVGSNVVLVSPQAGFFTDLGLEIDFSNWFTSYPDYLPTSLPLLVANDIENLVGSGGDNTLVLHGDAYFQGSVTADNLTIDYSDFSDSADARDGVEVFFADTGFAGDTSLSSYFDTSNEVNVNSYGGIDIELWPDLTIPIIGTIEGWSSSFGYAEGVMGERLGGFSSYVDFISSQLGVDTSLLQSFSQIGVSGLTGVVDSSGNDVLVGDGDEQTFELGNGGFDLVDGGGGTPNAGEGDTGSAISVSFTDSSVGEDVFDTLSLASADFQSIIDLSSGAVFNANGATTGFNALDYNPANFTDYRNLAISQIAMLRDIEGAQGGQQADLIIGTSGVDKFTLGLDDIGDVIMGNGEEDIIDLTDLPIWTGIEVISDSATITSIIDNNADLSANRPDESNSELKLIRFDGDNNQVIVFYGNAQIEGASDLERALKVLKNVPILGRVISAVDPSNADQLAPVQTGSSIDAAFIASQSFTDLVNTAKTNWQAVVGNELVSQYLSNLNFQAIDLNSSVSSNLTDTALGYATGNVTDGFNIALDNTASGYGWYTAQADTVGVGEIDLLSVLMHEMGHILGVTHADVSNADLMTDIINTGERRLPQAGSYDVADQQLLQQGLDAFQSWAGGLGDRALELLDLGSQSIPFLSVNFADILGLPADLGQQISNIVGSRINDQLAGLFGTDINTGDILNIDGISIAEGYTGEKAFAVDLDLLGAGLGLQSLSLDLADLSFEGMDIGFGDLPISIQNAPNIDIAASLDLNFVFGLDSEGQFFIDTPQLDAGVRILDEAINTELSLLGVVGAQINNGLIDIGMGLDLSYDGQLNLSTLETNGVDPSLLNPSWGGNNYYQIDLPIALTGAMAGLVNDIRISADSAAIGSAQLSDVNGNAAGGLSPVELLASLPFTLQLDGFEDLKNFRNLSLQDLLQVVLDTLDSWLDTSNTDSPLFQKIPGLNQSINDLLDQRPGSDGLFTSIRDVVAGIQAAASTFNNLGAAQDAMNTAIEGLIDDAFGLSNYAHPDYFTFSYEDEVLLTELDIDALFSDNLALDVNLTDYLSDIGLGDLESYLGESLSMNATTDLQVNAFADLYLGVGADLSGLSQPVTDLNAASFDPRQFMFVESDSGLRLGASVIANDIDAEVSIALPTLPNSVPFGNLLSDLELGIWVENGFLSAEIEGFVGLQAKADGSDYSIDDLINAGSSAFDYDISADALLELPLYFPTASLPLGGTTKDKNLDGVADNSLQITGGYELGNGFNYDISQVDLSNMFNLYAMLDNPQFVKDALNGMFDTLNTTMTNQLGGLELPFVGAAFSEVGNFVNELKTDLLTTNIVLINSSILEFLDTAIANNQGTYEALKGLGVAGADSLLDILEKAIEDGFGLADEEVVTVTTDEGFSFDFLVAGDVFQQQTLPLDFALSMPGLPMEASGAGGITLSMDYAMGLGFGFSGNDGFYLNTEGATEDGNEIELNLIAQLDSGTQLDLNLAFLTGSMQEYADSDGNSRLQGQIYVDLQDSGNDGKWTVFGGSESGNDSLSLTAGLNAFANVDLFLDAGLDVGGTASLPNVSTLFRYDQVFADITVDTSGSSSSLLESPQVSFEDVTVDFGTFISGVLDPVISGIEPIIDPLNTVLELFRKELDLGVTKISLLGLIDLAFPGAKPPQLEKALLVLTFIEQFTDFVTLVRDASAEGESININVGSFTLGGDILGDSSTSGAGGEKWQPSSSLQTDTRNRQSLANTSSSSSGSKNDELIKGINGGDKGGFDIPLLTSPSSALGLLLGKNVDLFIYDLPDLELGFDWRQSYPVFPGLNANIGGGVGLDVNFSFGFDTRGVQQLIDGGSVDDIFNGFYFSDNWVTDVNGTIIDNAEITATASLIAGASLGIGGLVEAGVEGGVGTEIKFDLNDVIADNKLYIDELASRLSQPQCLFDINGILSVYLDGFLWTGVRVFGAEITLFEARERFAEAAYTLFDYSCVEQTRTVYSQSGGTLSVFADSELRSEYGGSDVISVEYKENFDPDGSELPASENRYEADNWIKLTVNGFVEWVKADGIQRIEMLGTSSNDTLRVLGSATAQFDVFIDGGAGNDNISVEGANNNASSSRTLVGGEGNDLILGSDSADILVGGSGDDVILAGEGGDVIYGDKNASIARNADNGADGNDTLRGMQGADQLIAGGGTDYLLGGQGRDVLDAGAGEDLIDWYVGDGSDTIEGGGGNDTLKQQSYTRDNKGIITDSGAIDNIFVSAQSGGQISWNSDVISLNGLESVIIDTGDGADRIQVEDLSDTLLTSVTLIAGSTRGTRDEDRPVQVFNEATQAWEFNGETDTFTITGKATDGDRDLITIVGGDNDDSYLLSSPELANGDPDTGELAYELQIQQGRVSEASPRVNIRIQELDNAGNGGGDAVILDAGKGNDQIDLSSMTPTATAQGQVVQELYLLGNEGDDTLLGSVFGDILIGGVGADTITGGRGVDQFTLNNVPTDAASKLSSLYNGASLVEIDVAREASGRTDVNGQPIYVQDTLIENWDGNFLLNDNRLVTTLGLGEGNGFIDNVAQGNNEDENLANVFERVELSAAADTNGGQNQFIVFDYTFDAQLDGGYNADSYVVSLTGTPLRNSIIEITDTGPSLFADEALLLGNDNADAYRYDVDEQSRGFVERYANRTVIDSLFSGLDVDVLVDNIDQDGETGLNSNVRDLEGSLGADSITQRLIYESAETLVTEARGGDDLFIVDDSTLELNIYGEAGNDQFFIGRVKATETYTNELGREFTLVTDITNGVQVTSYFYGGIGDDYFEVNRNKGEIFLYGQDGDDVFYLKAHLQRNGNSEEEIGAENVTLSGGDEKGNISEGDADALFSYVDNNKVNILGGGGFDSLVIGGTDADDEFYIFTEMVDGKEVQRLYGAGLVIEQIDSIERFIILTGKGDDTVYVYGTLEGQQLLINTGSSFDTNKGDRVVFGGDAINFNIDLPASADSQKFIGNAFVDGAEVTVSNPSQAIYRRLSWAEIAADAARLNAWNLMVEEYFTPYSGLFFGLPRSVPLSEAIYNRLSSVLSSQYSADSGPLQSPWQVAYNWSQTMAEELYQFGGYTSFYYYFYNQALVRSGEYVSDMLDLFYQTDVTIPQYDVSTSIQSLSDTKLNFQADLPDRVLPGYMPANYDLSKLQGEVQVVGASPFVTLEINHTASDEGDTNAILTTVDVESAPLVIDPAVLNNVSQIANGNVNRALLTQDVQDTIRRMHQITANGIVDEILETSNRNDSTAVTLIAGQMIQSYEGSSVETDLQAYLDRYGYGSPINNTSSAAVNIQVYESVLSSGGSPEGFTTTQYFGTENNYVTDQLQRIGFSQTPGGAEQFNVSTAEELNTLLADNDLLFDNYFTHSSYATTDAGRGLYEVFLYRSGESQPIARLIDVPALERLRDAETDGTKRAELQSLIDGSSPYDYRNAAGWTAGNFDAASVANYVKTQYSLRDSSLNPVERSIEEEIYRSSQAAVVEEVRVVRTLATDSNGFVVNDSNGNPVLASVKVYANNALTLDIPNTFVTGKGDADRVSSTVYDTVQGLGTPFGIFYRNVTSLELNLDTNPATSSDVALNNNTLQVNGFNQVTNVQINTGRGDDVLRFGERLFNQQGTVDSADDIYLYTSLDAIDANVQVNTGSGNDKLYFSTADNLTAMDLSVSNNTLNGLQMANGVSYSELEYLRITTGESTDQVTVMSTNGATRTLIDTKGGNDQVVVSNASNSVDEIEGELRISLGNGAADRLLLNDTGDATGDNIVMDDARLIDPDSQPANLVGDLLEQTFIGVSGMSAGDIFYRDEDGLLVNDGLVLRAGSGGNRLDIYNILASDHTEIYTGGGDDLAIVHDFDISGRTPTLTIYGENGSDFINASASPVGISAYGNLPNQDVATGVSDNDIVFGSRFNDLIETQSGNDIVIANDGEDQINGGLGNDILVGDSAEVITSTGLAAGGYGIVASVTSNNVDAGANDTIQGNDGDDVLIGGLGEDILDGGNGNDVIIGDNGKVSFFNGQLAQVETIPDFKGGADNLTGGDGTDIIFGGTGSDTIDGNFIDDTIVGFDGRITYEVNDLDNVIKSLIILGVSGQDITGTSLGSLYDRNDNARDISEVYSIKKSELGKVKSLDLSSLSSQGFAGSSTQLAYVNTRSTSSGSAPIAIKPQLDIVKKEVPHAHKTQAKQAQPKEEIAPTIEEVLVEPVEQTQAVSQPEIALEANEPVLEKPAPPQTTKEDDSEDVLDEVATAVSAAAAIAASALGWKVVAAKGAASAAKAGAAKAGATKAAVSASDMEKLDEAANKRRFIRWGGGK